MRRADSGLVLKYEARPNQTQFWFQKSVRRAQSELFGLRQQDTFVRDSDFSLHPRKTTNLEANSTATSDYGGIEESKASRASQQTGQGQLPGVTGNTPVSTARNNFSAALASLSVNVTGRPGTRPSSRQAMASTTHGFVYEGASSVAQEHVERDASVEVLQLHHVGGMQSTCGAGISVFRSSGTAVDLYGCSCA